MRRDNRFKWKWVWFLVVEFEEIISIRKEIDGKEKRREARGVKKDKNNGRLMWERVTGLKKDYKVYSQQNKK